MSLLLKYIAFDVCMMKIYGGGKCLRRQNFDAPNLVHPERSIRAYHISEAILEANSEILFLRNLRKTS